MRWDNSPSTRHAGQPAIQSMQIFPSNNPALFILGPHFPCPYLVPLGCRAQRMDVGVNSVGRPRDTERERGKEGWKKEKILPPRKFKWRTSRARNTTCSTSFWSRVELKKNKTSITGDKKGNFHSWFLCHDKRGIGHSLTDCNRSCKSALAYQLGNNTIYSNGGLKKRLYWCHDKHLWRLKIP